MAPRLWNDDVLLHILDYLAPSSFPATREDRPGLTALARCARSSKALCDPALRVLWRQVDSLSVVTSRAAALTSTLVAVKSCHRLTQLLLTQDLVDEIEDSQFSRVRYYASFVKKLSHRADLDRIPPAVLGRFNYLLKGAVLFHRLLNFHWHQRVLLDYVDMLSLVPPTLRELTLGGILSSGTDAMALRMIDHHSVFVNIINQVAPQLNALTLSGCIPFSSILGLGSLRNLQSLRVINCSSHVLQPTHVPFLQSCALMDLKEFCINLTGDSDAFEPDTFECGYSTLRTLRVHGSLSLITRFLSHVSSPDLAAFSAFVSRPENWQEFRDVYSTLTTQFSSSLRSISISGPWTGCAQTLESVGPLLTLPRLEVINLVGCGVATSLSERDVQAMAHAWPRLQRLTLLYNALSRSLPIWSLRAFAERCPDLHTLILSSIDLRTASSPAPVGTDSSPFTSNHMLKHMWLTGDVEANGVNAIHVARAIDSIFPSLELGPFDCPWHPTWNARSFRRTLECLQTAKEERRLERAAGVTRVAVAPSLSARVPIITPPVGVLSEVQG
ncbi:uncharacterized protein BXZ73DRAFT_47098 [Epithele typhae]|uniref:uncharacterized protein n=1 Tax=Epithele typhae TaxID=378194 RepID=UPI0020074258|nr:uncharacterized protein BXZ73DRAFT_47098 [Epithele typhae]KAH9931709.1 hypothetical protein BXZ73DRAFT_47098 [Epithele typhae]